MPISPLPRNLCKMKYWEPEIRQLVPNCNRHDLWNLIETKSDFFENIDKYLKKNIQGIDTFESFK